MNHPSLARRVLTTADPTDPRTPGQIAFDAYSTYTGNLTHDGKAIPAWRALSERVRGAWESAARAVLER